jgi:hypothetical protein
LRPVQPSGTEDGHAAACVLAEGERPAARVRCLQGTLAA